MSVGERNRYVERLERAGHLTIEPVFPNEDGGTGDRWAVNWAPAEGALVDIDASARTLEEALLSMCVGLAEEVLDLRTRVAS